MSIDPAVEAFGSATLLRTASLDMTADFGEWGSSAVPLGHNENDPSKGVVFGIGPGRGHSGHALTFGRTRGGKGVSAIIPALLTYAGSMMVIDPKGENAWLTAERRRQMGHRVVILDPWGEVNRRFGSKVGIEEPIRKFNPLAALDPESPEFVDDVTAISEAFIFQTGSDPHWSDSARDLTSGLIAAEVQRNPGNASMQSVRQLLRASTDDLIAAVKATIEDFPDGVASAKLGAIIEVDENGEIANNRELASIRSTARTQTSFLDSVRLVESMETEDDPFDLGDLAKWQVTVYLVLPVDRLRSHGRWLRMILTLAIRAIAKADNLPALPVVFLLDELGTISPGFGLSMIEQSFGLMAGLGIRIWAFLQDLPQLQRDYRDSWETFISNSSVIQLLNVADNTTAQYFSTYLGNGTINAKTGQWSWKHKPWSPDGPNFYERFDIAVRERLRTKYGFTEAQAFRAVPQQPKSAVEIVDRPRPDDPFGIGTSPSSYEETDNWKKEKARLTSILVEARYYVSRTAQEREQNANGYHAWEPDTQLMSRPVLFPWEIVAMPG